MSRFGGTMRKSGDFNDDLEEAKAFFPRRSHKAVEQLVKRVQAMEAEKAGKNVKAALQALAGGTSSSTSMNWTLGRELGKALGQRGGHVESPSIRQKAAGGRPFHFAHSTVKKADVPRAATGGKGQLKLGKAAAHMRYIERELAVEATYGLSPEALGRDHQERDGGPAGDRPKDDRRWDRDAAYRAVGENSAAHQGYVENPVKLESGEVVTFSFGTIGETFAERVRFWEALEASEPHPSARVQERLIIELPHEASPDARHRMMRRFCEQFDELGVPYWAALHAPGMKNDSRNFHCHIAYSERPAKRIVDPADGTKKWDFEIVARRRKPSGDLQPPTRPHRQKKHDFFRPRDAIRMMRERMAAAANEILSADDVRDGKGEPVRYDPRSYADMGLDVVPIRSISRIVADKMRAGKITVLDPAYTRRQIEAQIREAAVAREPQVLELLQLDKALEAMTRRPATAHRENGRLPKDLRVSPLAMLSGTALRAAGQRMMRARHEALIVDVMERSTVDALSAMARATDPAVVETARKNTRDPVRLAALPDVEAARLLHQGARAMIEEARAEARDRRRTARYRIGATAQAWRELVGPIDLSPTPGTRIAIERMREERPTGAWEKSREPETDGGRAGPARARATTAITVERTESGRTEMARAAAAHPPADQRPSHRGVAKHSPSPDSGSRTQPPGAAGVARPDGLTAAPPARSGQAGVVQGSGQRPGLVPAAWAFGASAAASDMINRLRGEVEPDNALAALRALVDGLRAQQAAKKQALEGMQAALAARLQAAAAARVMGQPSPDAGAAEIGAAPGEAAARGGLTNSLATEAGAERTVRRGEAHEPARPMKMQPRPEVGAARSNEGGPGVARRSVAEPANPRAVAPPEITASADVTAGSPVGRLDPASATAAGQAAAPSPPEAIPGPAVDKPRRRKRTKEEEEREKKRKAQRQAVLAKRNKGRGR